MLKFPYGIANFYSIITEGYLYIDRTDRIRLLEETGPTLLFIRPRRFGKSLFLSVLENYYDVNRADEFGRLFGHLAIGKNPTPKRNQYFILKWNFSAVATQGDEHDIKRTLYNHINNGVYEFALRYNALLSHQINITPDDGIASFSSLMAVISTTPYKLYLLIDEYDNFANQVLMGGGVDSQKRYEALIEGEGLLKVLFKAIKAGLEGRGLERVFLTGVSPVVMSDVTSSFNIARNIYLDPQFNDLCGFREDELVLLLQQVGQACGFSQPEIDKVLETMRTFYNGFSFTYGQKPILYNPTLVLYFLEHLQKSCDYPREMLDSNLAMDRQKIAYIANLVNGEQVIAQALNEEQPLVTAKLANRFGVQDILQKTNDTQFMVSLLYYFGVLTLTEQYTDWGELIFKIPNLVTKQLYVERIRETLLPTGSELDQVYQVARQFYRQGDMAVVCEFIEQKYFPLFDNRDYRWTNELTIKTLFMTVLFNDTFYIMESETSLQREYSDLTMIVRPDMRQFILLDFLLEFKYLSLKQLGLSGEQVRAMNNETLTELEIVKEQLNQAKDKLEKYQPALQTSYDNKLRLRCYSVVSIGYERLIWQELKTPS